MDAHVGSGATTSSSWRNPPSSRAASTKCPRRSPANTPTGCRATTRATTCRRQGGGVAFVVIVVGPPPPLIVPPPPGIPPGGIDGDSAKYIFVAMAVAAIVAFPFIAVGLAVGHPEPDDEVITAIDRINRYND